jgi:hypothetical protein
MRRFMATIAAAVAAASWSGPAVAHGHAVGGGRPMVGGYYSRPSAPSYYAPPAPAWHQAPAYRPPVYHAPVYGYAPVIRHDVWCYIPGYGTILVRECFPPGVRLSRPGW